MDITFTCPTCKQQLQAESAMSGTEISCPTCEAKIVIPQADPANLHVNPIASSAAAKLEYHFQVPVHEAPSEMLIQKPQAPLEAAKDGPKTMKIRTIKRTECVEVGHDRFDEIVSAFLTKLGQENIISINTINYTHLDIGSQKLMTDYGVMIIFRG